MRILRRWWKIILQLMAYLKPRNSQGQPLHVRTRIISGFIVHRKDRWNSSFLHSILGYTFTSSISSQKNVILFTYHSNHTSPSPDIKSTEVIWQPCTECCTHTNTLPRVPEYSALRKKKKPIPFRFSITCPRRSTYLYNLENNTSTSP